MTQTNSTTMENLQTQPTRTDDDGVVVPCALPDAMMQLTTAESVRL